MDTSILIYDESPEIAELLSVVVRRAGHEPVVLAHGEPIEDFDLLILEPASPGALHLARVVRGLPPHIGSSASASTPSLRRSRLSLPTPTSSSHSSSTSSDIIV